MTYDDHADCDKQLNEAEEQILNLKTENKELLEYLIEYGRHAPGCSQEFAKKYRCRCGWDKVEQALKGK